MTVKSYVKKNGTRVRSYSRKENKNKNGYAIYVSDRRTPILVDGNLTKAQAIKKALLTKKRGSNNVDLVRRLTDKEQIKADKGEWVKGHNIDKDRKNLRGVGPKPIGFNFSSNSLNFAKPFNPLKKEQLQKLLTAGKSWAKRNRIKSEDVYTGVHDSMHVIGEKLRPNYRLAPVNPKLIKKNLSLTEEISNPFGKAQRMNILDSLSNRLTKKKNMKVESYISGLEGAKKITRDLDFDLSVNRPPNRKELEAYWNGRRDRKKRLPKEYKTLQRQTSTQTDSVESVFNETKAEKTVKPAGSFYQTKAHPRRTKTGKITRVRNFRSRSKAKPKSDFGFDISDFL